MIIPMKIKDDCFEQVLKNDLNNIFVQVHEIPKYGNS